ncbi:3'(2'),5'-bisphosphate nucleotidase CysQ [Leptolyngbya sp. FACHB-261]|nr:3'(2'),5'-bisphosphate nucleotidase CysQ [Leptolyngbya sp. FACHB-261]
MPDLSALLPIARNAAWGAADILLEHYNGHSDLQVDEKKDGPVTAADLAVNRHLLSTLQTALGNEHFAYLSEETADVPSRFEKQWVWIIDPLDGTRDFIDRTGEFAVHIALVHQGRPVLAVVAYPMVQKLYTAVQGQGSQVETRDGTAHALQVSDRQQPEQMRLIVSRSHRDGKLDRLLAKLPKADQRAVGSIGCKFASITEQETDFYVALSGKSAPKDWDLAAPELILTEAGGQVSRFDGSLLEYNRADVSQWGGILASNGHAHNKLCALAEAALAEVT